MASRFWVGNTATWDATAGTKWATTSGAAGGASVPTSADDVFFDGNSGAVTVTTAVSARPCKSLTLSAFTGTISLSENINISGSITGDSGTTMTGGNNVNIIATGTITCNGMSINRLNIDATGNTVNLGDSLFVSTNFFVTNGTFNTNNNNATTSSYFQSGGTSNLGSSTWNITNTGWTYSSGTLNTGNSTIKFINTTLPCIFIGGGQTYNNIWFNVGTNTSTHTIVGSNTFNNLKDTGTATHTLAFTAGTTQTLNTFSVIGNPGSHISIDSTTTSTYTLVKTGGGIVSSNYLNIQHSIATPTSTWYAGVNSVNNQAVATAGSGWIFTTPSPGLFGNVSTITNLQTLIL